MNEPLPYQAIVFSRLTAEKDLQSSPTALAKCDNYFQHLITRVFGNTEARKKFGSGLVYFRLGVEGSGNSRSPPAATTPLAHAPNPAIAPVRGDKAFLYWRW